ncbi:YgfZ/GcvT domain-containing protein [Ideonella sp.]|uniref:CAF17-like 4Fe-4S cluster assembly/insertion protein YgfZ n=1 Tax=Ideonella sp. TaxID=1929293 RepID=UPI003BB5AB08
MNDAALLPTPADLSADRFSGAVRLDDWGLIRARGADARSFLQGQLTNDLTSLPMGQACLAAYCSAKGRMMASFVVWQAGPEEWLLACSADVLPQTLKRLSMFVMRAKCQLTDASADWPLWGLCGDAASAWLAAARPAQAWQVMAAPAGTSSADSSGQAVRLPDVDGLFRGLWCGPRASAPAALPPLPMQTWQWLEVRSGVVRIMAATAEAFVPQMVNFELVGGVSFKKGCYPGQEVVARSQYRGTLKRRGSLLAADQAMAVGTEVFHDADPGQPAGVVALSAGLDGAQFLAFAELKLAALLTGSLHLGAADGPLLRPQPLPYALPADAS